MWDGQDGAASSSCGQAEAGNPADDADDASSWSEWLVPEDEEVVEMEEEAPKTPLLSPQDGYAVTAKLVEVKHEELDETVKDELLDENDDNIVKRVLAEAVCKTIGKGLLEVKQEMTQVVECCSLVIHIFIIAMRTLK